jgi:UDP-glucose 4-epimerase
MAAEKILVVGGAGYIGSQCAKELHKRGYQPLVLDDLSRGYKENVRWGEVVEGNLGDSALLKNLFAEHNIAAVMHFAAFALVGESVEKPEMYEENNVTHTLSLLRAMRAANVERFIFSSTCATFGNPVEIPMTETHPQNPINPYGQTKLDVEKKLAEYATDYGLKYAALRYFNAAGADPDGETGERHEPESHLIPNVLKAALGQIPAVKVFGTDYDTPDGTCVRDYIHTVDLAQAHILALEALKKDSKPLIYNLGNGTGYSVRQVIDKVKEVSGQDFKVIEEARRPGDPPTLIGSAAKIKKELGWEPQYPDLETIVRHAHAYAQANA